MAQKEAHSLEWVFLWALAWREAGQSKPDTHLVSGGSYQIRLVIVHSALTHRGPTQSLDELGQSLGLDLGELDLKYQFFGFLV
jgi:hypothetical protein